MENRQKPLGKVSKTTSSVRRKKDPYTDLLSELAELLHYLTIMESEASETLGKVDPRHRVSAANLIHYLGLSRRDVRPLQEKLAAAGLSSMGHAEFHVLSNLKAIIILLEQALRQQGQPTLSSIMDSSAMGPALLETNTNDLLGKPPAQRRVRILVTLPGAAANDYLLIKDCFFRAWIARVSIVRTMTLPSGRA
ncbi:hypothetical protein C8R31_104303 [Nitrosospira sp. Nsp2]|uniref:hypothetical protein n=1 Tax=Nitrosospira sp. Nsp2 TaxID=136548 RepID=UPI000D2FB7FD|nr:hypothetical protein [Nitrosospira sp. Nsp2]PTR15273.1 hypothetical protein C8R31_104303 [Nitrosospira sp. Nsp2]